jgi:hypothetical protein
VDLNHRPWVLSPNISLLKNVCLHELVAFGAQREKIGFLIRALLTAQLLVMKLKIVS